ncbi:MAG: type II toxin-antitoxin system VapC family toxin [Candidatus Doudnabacteria bacterium]|nr:type II toxin-antitoxin system VapC family toxin [Candidatus Doudnabacteria bacterium]
MPTEITTEHIKRVVIDASIAVKLFSEEAGTTQAENLLARCFAGSAELFAPDLLIYEVVNALGKGKKFSAGEITEAIEDLYNSRIQIFPPDTLLTSTAVEIMTRHNLTFYDASYAALSKILNIPLLSADARAHKKIPDIETIELL